MELINSFHCSEEIKVHIDICICGHYKNFHGGLKKCWKKNCDCNKLKFREHNLLQKKTHKTNINIEDICACGHERTFHIGLNKCEVENCNCKEFLL